MLFDERPKESKEDLYDREGEIDELKRAIDRPLVVLRGIRRIGKTSVLKVALKGLDRPSVVMDARGLKTNYGRRELYSMFARALSSSSDKLRDLISSVRGIKVLGYEVELSWALLLRFISASCKAASVGGQRKISRSAKKRGAGSGSIARICCASVAILACVKCSA